MLQWKQKRKPPNGYDYGEPTVSYVHISVQQNLQGKGVGGLILHN